MHFAALGSMGHCQHACLSLVNAMSVLARNACLAQKAVCIGPYEALRLN